jgi:predicted sulfurtransferase
MFKYYLTFFCLLSSQLIAQIKSPEYKQTIDSLYKKTVPLISIEELIKIDKYNLYILDTREEDEFNVSHLKNARQVGNFWFDMRKVYDIPATATVVVYCSVGVRSETC